MPDFIPLTPSDTNYELRLTFDSLVYLFAVRWNSRDESFYLSIYEQNTGPTTGRSRVPVIEGARLVLGVNIGRSSSHPFFSRHTFKMVDSSQQGIEALYDDIGTRVFLMHMSIDEIRNIDETVEAP